MKLIISRNVYQTNNDFFKVINEMKNDIEGISIEVILTKDGIPIVMSPSTSDSLNSQIIKSIQSTNFNDITEYEVLTLSTTLNMLRGVIKKIIINFIPMSTVPLAQNIEAVNEFNKRQVEELYKVLDQYPDLNIYVSSISHNIIFHINNRHSNNKVGVIITPYETNYIDVDFYIFSPGLLSLPLLKQQLRFNKEVMVASRDCEDLMHIYNFFNTISNPERNIIFNATSFISNYPIIIYNLFN